MLVVDSFQEPLDVLVVSDDAWQAENLERRVVRMDTHVHVALLADRHYGSEEVGHVLAQLVAVYALVQGEELSEKLYGMLVALLEVAADESLCLYHDVLDESVVFLRIHGQAQLLHLPQYISSVRLSVRSEHLKVLPVVDSALAFEYVYVKIGELRDAEIEVACAVGVRVEQVSACPVEHWHEVIAYAVYALLAEVGERLLIHLYLLLTVGTAILDGLGDGQ